MGLQVNSKPLYVAIAQKKSDRQRRLKTYFQQPPGSNFQNPQGMGMGMPYYPGASPSIASPTMYSCAVPSRVYANFVKCALVTFVMSEKLYDTRVLC